MLRGEVGSAYLLSGPFVCRCLTGRTMFRFHISTLPEFIRPPGLACARPAATNSPPDVNFYAILGFHMVLAPEVEATSQS